MGASTSTPLQPGPLFAQGERALTLRGSPYTLPQLKGRGHQLQLAPLATAPAPLPSFMPEASSDGTLALRLSSDPALALEVEQRRFEPGARCSLWACDGHPEWAVRWVLQAEGTLAPARNSAVVLGVGEGGTPVLVQRDSAQRLVLLVGAGAAPAALARWQGQAAAARAALDAQALALATPAALQHLREHGLVKLEGCCPLPLVRAALREVNRALGAATAASGGVDALRARTFAQRSEVTALFNASALPRIMARLLGPLPQGAPYHQASGQLALRFPGDMCPGGDPAAALTPPALLALRRAWHIDGLPSAHIAGVTDHWGEIHNFDLLVGVLLEDVLQPHSGELCAYPGSHVALAGHLAAHSLLPRLCAEGHAALPTGAATEAALGQATPHHCTGRAGDAFLLCYGTAHFVAPNTSPHIRYAVYFRVRGPGFGGRLHCAAAMLAPLAHLARLHDLVGAEGGSEAAAAAAAAATAAQIQADERLAHSLAANNDHTTAPGVQRSTF